MIDKIINGVESYGFRCKGWIESPLKGAEGNIEFLACFMRQCTKDSDHSTAEKPTVDSWQWLTLCSIKKTRGGQFC